MSKQRLSPLGRRALLKTGITAAVVAVMPSAGLEAQPLPIPRSRTLIVTWGGRDGLWVDWDLWNPYAIGSDHQNGLNLIYEPLAYYSAFTDKTYMWLAEAYEFSSDYRRLTIRTRRNVRWSDDEPFSADDVAYTLNMLRELGRTVRWGIEIQEVVDRIAVPDSNTVIIDFKLPSPRFFSFLTYKFDIGVHIVPRHIFQGQDWSKFKNFDLAREWPISTGPWQVVAGSPEQKIFDRRSAWWAAEQTLAPLPVVERNIWLPFQSEQSSARALAGNHLDAGPVMQPASFQPLFRSNPKITTYTGQKQPFGYMDWWPISLYLNNERSPFNDKDVRWALSYYIDRQQVIDIGFLGASTISTLPLPPYLPLLHYIDAVDDLLAKYDTSEYAPRKADALLAGKGFVKEAGGFWTNAQGKRIKLDIIGLGSSGSAIGPVLAETLKRHGIEASFALPPDFDDRLRDGEFDGAIYGHGGSVREPYAAMRLYQSVSIAVPGAHQVNFTRWRNAEYDKLVDEAYGVAPEDKEKLTEIWRRAMEIWLPELPDIQLVQNYQRIPWNTNYWKNWPTKQNPYTGGAHFQLTFAMVLWNLRQA